MTRRSKQPAQQPTIQLTNRFHQWWAGVKQKEDEAFKRNAKDTIKVIGQHLIALEQLDAAEEFHKHDRERHPEKKRPS